MGMFHGAEICELVGLYLLSQILEIIPNVGLFIEKGLCVSSATPRQNEIITNKICQVFEKTGLSVTIESNSILVNFLDITYNIHLG